MAEGKSALDKGRMLQSAKDQVSSVKQLLDLMKKYASEGKDWSEITVPDDLAKASEPSLLACDTEIEDMASSMETTDPSHQEAAQVSSDLKATFEALRTILGPAMQSDLGKIDKWLDSLWAEEDAEAGANKRLVPANVQDPEWKKQLILHGPLSVLCQLVLVCWWVADCVL